MAEPSDEQRYLGRAGRTEFAVLQTASAWLADVEAIVLSVGTELGSLARAVQRNTPRADWRSIDLAAISPSSPQLLELSDPSSSSAGPRWAVLATLHASPRKEPTRDEALDAIPVAVEAALAAAAGASARTVLLPILGTGAMGLPADQATEAVLAAAVGVARSPAASAIESVLFLARDFAATLRIENIWSRIGPRPDEVPRSGSTSAPASEAPPPSSPSEGAPTTGPASTTAPASKIPPAVGESPPDVVARLAGLASPMSPDLRTLLTAAVSLLPQKVSANEVMSFTTVFLAAVEWGANADVTPTAPPELQRLANAVTANPDAYAELVRDVVRSAPPLVRLEPDETPLPEFRVSENLQRAFVAAERAADGSLDAPQLLQSILRLVATPEGESSWLNGRLRARGLDPERLLDALTGQAEVRAEYAAQLGSAETMSARLVAALGYAGLIAQRREEAIDSRTVFAGLVEAERRDGSTTLSTAIYGLLSPVQADASARPDPFYLASLGIEGGLPDPPGEIPPADRWSDDGLRLVADARRIAAATSEGPRLACRHVFAAAVGAPRFEVWEWLASHGVDPNRIQTLILRAQLNFPVTGDKVEAWVALLDPRQGVVQISSYNSDLVEIGSPLTDRLGIEKDVEAISAVVMASDVKPPMSIGLFGDWGAGKTYFMSLMHEQIGALATRAKAASAAKESTSFCSEVVQIDFNAWHFVDSNLWASIVTRIFSELARHLGGTEENAYRRALQELLDKTQRAKDVVEQVTGVEARLNDEIKGYEEELSKLETEIRETKAQTPSVEDIIGAAIQDPGVRGSIASASRTLGIDEIPQTASQLWDAIASARSFPARIRGLANWITGSKEAPGRARRFFSLIALVAIVVGVPLLIGWFVADRVGGPDQTLVGVVSFAGSAIALLATVVRKGARAVDRALGELETARDRLNASMTAQQLEKQQRITAQLKAAEEKRLEASRRLADAKAELNTAQSNQAKLDLSSFLFEWIVQRSSRTEYRDQLGIISFIREDFEQLEDLLKEKGEGDSALRPVDRIVLYIDDLDRCPSDRVIEVLQAVHLLLAFPLFVVVVGVDPRWLLHSLEHEYTAFGASSLDERTESRGAGQWRTTPHHYLEKIFQIPFTLRPMEKTGFTNLITDLAGSAGGQRPPSGEQGETGSAATSAASSTASSAERAIPPDSASTPDDAGDGVAASVDSSDARPDDGGGTDAAAEPPAPADAGAGGAGSAATGTVEDAGPRGHTIDPAPRFLDISDEERVFMAELDALVVSPRATKRLINTYRLVKATVTPTELARLESGDYRAALLMLAMQGGHPDEAADIFRELSRRKEGSWWGFVAEWEPRPRGGSAGGYRNELVDVMSEATAVGWRELHDAMLNQQAHAPEDDLRTFVRLWPAVARFGFATGRAVTKVMQ